MTDTAPPATLPDREHLVDSLHARLMAKWNGLEFDILEVMPRRYLREHCHLLRLRMHEDDGSTDELWCLCNTDPSGNGGDADIRAHTLGDARTTARHKHECRDWFVLDDETQVEEYFLDFFPFRHPCLLPSMLDGQDPDIPGLALEWFTPLEAHEREALRDIVQRHPFRVSRRDGDSFVIDACLLDGSRVDACRIEMFQRDIEIKENRKTLTRMPKGEFTIIAREHAYACLPDNHRIVPGSVPGSTMHDSPPGPDGWQAVDGDEASLIQRDLQRLLREAWAQGAIPEQTMLLSNPNTRIRSQRLGFYGLELLEVSSANPSPAKAHLLWKPGFARVLDGSSTPIHDHNRSIDRHPLLQFTRDAKDYLRFFCEHVWGDRGPFHVLDGRNDSSLDWITPLTAEIDPDSHASVDEVLDLIEPPCLLDCTQDDASDGMCWRISSFILYDEVIFKAIFKVSADGPVEMEDDEPLLMRTRKDAPDETQEDEKARLDAEWEQRRRDTYLPLVQLDRIGKVIVGGQEARQRLMRLNAEDVAEPLILEKHIVRGFIDLSSSVLNRPLAFRDCIFEAGACLDDMQCPGGLHMEDCIFLETGSSGCSLSMQRTSVGNLKLGRITAHADLKASKLRITNQLDIQRASIAGRLDLEGTSAWAVEAGFIHAGHGLELAHSAVQQYIHLHSIRSDGPISLFSTVVSHGHIGLSDIHCEGDLSANFMRAGTGMYLTTDQSATGNRVRGNVLLTACNAPGPLELVSTRIDGDLRMRHMDVRILKLLGSPTTRGDLSSEGATLPMSIGGGIDASSAHVRGEALLADVCVEDNLTLDGLECLGKFDLTGLRLIRGDGRGNVDARFARFNQQLCISLYGNGAAVIPGRLDLTGSSISELALSPDTFVPAAGKRGTPGDVRQHGVVLKETKITKFTICHDGDFYPSPIDLRHAEIKWWEFRNSGNPGDEGESDKVEDYIKLLRGDPHKQMHTFRSIEQNLVNRGHEDAADAIHWEMRKWLAEGDARNGWQALLRHPWRMSKLWSWDWLTSYRKGPLHILAIILAWLAFSTMLFSDPANIAPSTQGLIADKRMTPGEPPAQWTWNDGFWIALRHHVPVALFTAREAWEPGNDRPLQVAGRTISVLNAEDYANIVLILHWLLWPIMLVTTSRKYFRRSGG